MRVKKVEGWETETVADQLTRNRITLVSGTAKFLDEHHVEISPDGIGPHSKRADTTIRYIHIAAELLCITRAH